jgi:hypothetical protein
MEKKEAAKQPADKEPVKQPADKEAAKQPADKAVAKQPADKAVADKAADYKAADKAAADKAVADKAADYKAADKQAADKAAGDPADPVVAALTKASTGLRMPSESDAPFKPFAWKGGEPTAKAVLQWAGEDADASVEESTLDDLWRTIPKEEQAEFKVLRQVLQDQLSGVKVFKVGDEAERTVYILGKTKDGRLAGLQTSVVET